MSTPKPTISDDERFNVQLGLAAAQQPLDTDCPDVGDMAAYVDHQLSGQRKTTVESHLAHCPGCYTAWRDMVELLTPETPPETRAKLAASASAWWHRLTQWPVVGGGLATAMVAIFSVIILLPQPTIDEQLSGLYQQWPGATAHIDETFVSQAMKSTGRLTSQDLAYKQGLRDGLQRLVPNESEFWREVMIILTDLSGDCDNASDPPACQTALTLSRQIGQWVAINYLQCFATKPALDGQSPYWVEQQTLAKQLLTEVSKQSMDNKFQPRLTQIASQSQINKPTFCTQIEQLAVLGLH